MAHKRSWTAFKSCRPCCAIMRPARPGDVVPKIAFASRRCNKTGHNQQQINSAEANAAHGGASMSDLEIVWTKVDEAPGLATFTLLPIVQAFVSTAGVKMKLKDISPTGRIIANFP